MDAWMNGAVNGVSLVAFLVIGGFALWVSTWDSE